MSQAESRFKKIVVLGGGTAGLLAACAIARELPQVELAIVRSRKMGVIGVGEGTIPSVPSFLHQFLKIDVQRFNQLVQPSIKLGIKFHWGKRPFFYYPFSPQFTRQNQLLNHPNGYFVDESTQYADICSALMHHDRVALSDANGRPIFQSNYAYHLENQKFVEFLEKLTDQLGLVKLDAVVRDVEVDAVGVKALILEDGRSIEGDLFVDCSGFRSRLLGDALAEPFVPFDNALFCDRAVVGGWNRSDADVYHPYTTSETMNAGWLGKLNTMNL